MKNLNLNTQGLPSYVESHNFVFRAYRTEITNAPIKFTSPVWVFISPEVLTPNC